MPSPWTHKPGPGFFVLDSPDARGWVGPHGLDGWQAQVFDYRARDVTGTGTFRTAAAAKAFVSRRVRRLAGRPA